MGNVQVSLSLTATTSVETGRQNGTCQSMNQRVAVAKTGRCYIPATLKLTHDYLEEASGTLVPIGTIGLIPLLLIFIAMRKVSKAKKHLQG